jgi:3-methyladenine DNA glycosylase AlkD
MKKIIIMTCLGFAISLSGIAQDISKGSERAKRLSDQMIRELRLNNYQASRIRAINQEKINKMIEVERKFASNPELVDKTCLGICKQRDKEVESFLSSDQYGQYYAARTQYYKTDKLFASQIGMVNNKALTQKKQDPLPIGDRVTTVDTKSSTVLKPSETK